MLTIHDTHENAVIFKIKSVGKKWIEVENLNEIWCSKVDSFFEFNCLYSLPKVGKRRTFKIEKSKINEGDFILSNINKTNILITDTFRLELKRIILTKSQIERLFIG